MEMINNKGLFITILDTFESILNNCINIQNNNNIEKYYIDYKKSIIFKLTDMKYCFKFYIDNNNLIINDVLYKLDENNIYLKKKIDDKIYLY
jgi:hypothetical protein